MPVHLAERYEPMHTDCRTRMAKVKYSAGIDHVSGALSKPSKNGQHSCEKMLLATHRVAATESSDCNRLYLREAAKPRTNFSQNELAAQNRFTEVSLAVRTRAKDLNLVTQDQAAFAAQKDTAGGKRTMKAYLWQVCGQEYDSAHQG